jgi:ADP-heptose:LPS heptosyltransferase
MRMVEIIKDFTNNNTQFKAGRFFVMAEDIEGQLRSLYGNFMGMSYPIEQKYRQYKGEPLDNKRIMIFRTGGIGDLAFLNPVLRYIKKKYPTCFIRAASACKQCLENVPEINELYDMPFDVSLFDDTDFQLMFQGIIEASSEVSQKTHAVDMFFSYFNIDSTHIPAIDKKPKLFFTPAENEWLKKTLIAKGVKDDEYVIGIQMESSSPVRNFPKERLKVVVDTLSREEKVKIFMIGAPEHAMIGQWYKSNSPSVIIATDFTVRQSIVLAQRYNLVISPDSFMVQVAGALDKPQIGLYGPFPSEVRMKYFTNAMGLEPKVVCSPCFKHDFRGCIKGFPSPCFSLVTIEMLAQAVDYLRFKHTGTHFKYMDPFLYTPNLNGAEKYFLSADKGICFFPGYYTHPNMVRVDPNKLVKADISDLSSNFERNFYPFVLYMNEFAPKSLSVFNNSKQMVRPGGYFMAYARQGSEPMLAEIQKDIGNSGFVLVHSKFDPISREVLIIGRKPF